MDVDSIHNYYCQHDLNNRVDTVVPGVFANSQTDQILVNHGSKCHFGNHEKGGKDGADWCIHSCTQSCK